MVPTFLRSVGTSLDWPGDVGKCTVPMSARDSLELFITPPSAPPTVQSLVDRHFTLVLAMAFLPQQLQTFLTFLYNTEELMERVYKWHKSVVRKEWEAKGSPAPDADHVVGRRDLAQLGAKVEEVGRGEPVNLDKDLPKGRRRKSEFQAKIEWDVIDEAWRVIHPEVEEAALRTDWSFTTMGGGYDRLNSIMKKTGASEALKQAGLKEGEEVIVGKQKFSYNPEMIGKEANMLYGQLELKVVKEEEYKNPFRD
ncbi:unnamed protein product [Symbiodinium natans]|uniref:OCT domain-containing protein n=1 Tax=Symbiodinium natans TaxID=878477 RepID=A0A812JT88_9DINO|nr:unnamed protein product [Symbiodinium natans]